MNNDIIQFMIDDECKRRIMAHSKKLAAALINRFQIPAHECNLVYVIGTGNQRNNEEALAYWITQQLEVTAHEHFYAKELLAYLEHNLAKQLSSLSCLQQATNRLFF